LADPLEGVDYGPCKAKVMRRADGTAWIHSFAHGRTVYELKWDAAAVETALNNAPTREVAGTYIKYALNADLDAEQLDRLRDLTAQRAGVGRRAIDRQLKAASQEQKRDRQREAEEQRAAERQDPRPRIEVPSITAPWLPQMEVLNNVLGTSTAHEPPMRDLDGFVVQVRCRRVPSLHALTSGGSNGEETDETRLPAPEQPLLMRLDEAQLAELIERNIEYFDARSGAEVHLPSPFVKHFLQRSDNILPVVTAIATLPLVLPDGAILSGRGLDRQRGIVFRVPQQLQALLPRAEDCGPTVVASAMRFLTDEWLCDVATDYQGKCVLLAMVLTVLERLMLPERPAFFITAGQRGGGKTTAANMVSLAALGVRAAAAAWSPSDEKRRKSLLAYLAAGVPLITWDNIPRGAALACPSIEKVLTAETYSDRILGETGTMTVAATAVMAFTGNNVTARGDLASRSLTSRLAVNRPDPENRSFTHVDPLGWTEANRGRILAALYTILVGNPRLHATNRPPAETRFKAWWHLVGSAVEYAAKQHADHVAALVVDALPTCLPTVTSFRSLSSPASLKRNKAVASPPSWT
jgi:hypothetical protein